MISLPRVIEFEVVGQPKPQPRARSFVLRGKGGRPILKNGEPILRVHEAGTAENWKSCIAIAAEPHVPMPPLAGPLRVDIEFRFARPKAHFRTNGQLKPNAPHWFCASKNDRDNLDKAVLDALTVLGMWQDDCQVCAGQVMKIYADYHPEPELADNVARILGSQPAAAPQFKRPGATIRITQLEEPHRPNTQQTVPEPELTLCSSERKSPST